MRFGIKTLAFLIWLSSAVQVHATAPDVANLLLRVDGIDYETRLAPSAIAKNVRITSDQQASEVEIDVHLYQGTVPEVPNSWVSVSYYKGEWHGMASMYSKLYEINNTRSGTRMTHAGLAGTTSMLGTELLLGDDFDINRMCATAHPATSDSADSRGLRVQQIIPNRDQIRTRVSPLVGDISRVADVVLALDNTYLSQHGGEVPAIARAMRILNTVDALYRTELGIALNNIDIKTYTQDLRITNPRTNDPDELIETITSAQNTVFGLNIVADSQGVLRGGDDAHAFSALLTARPLEEGLLGNTLGIANLGGLCLFYATSITRDRGSESRATLILAHEMGHNLGSCHDGDPPQGEPPQDAVHVCRLSSQSCPDNTHIMAPRIVELASTNFSSCSMANIDDYLMAYSLPVCFKKPIDITLMLRDSPPINLVARQQISRTVVVENKGVLHVENVRIIGNIVGANAAPARFTQVTAAGAACTLSNSNQRYECTIARVPANSQPTEVEEGVQAGDSSGSFTLTTTFEDSSTDRVDIYPSNQEIIHAYAITAPPTAPGNLIARAQTDGSIVLDWEDNSSNETGFRIRRSSGSGTLANIATTGAGATSYTDPATGLVPGTAYTYEVAAYNTTGDSLPSGQAMAIALQPPPTNLVASARANGDIALAWTDSSREMGFRIRRSSNGVSPMDIATLAPDTRSYIDSAENLTAGELYTYVVIAENESGNALSTPSTATALDSTMPAPTAPSNLMASARSNGAILLTWEDNSSTETGFRIRRFGTDGALLDVIEVNADETSYTEDATDLIPGTEYTYEVVAIGATAGNTSSNLSLPTAALTPSSGGGGGGGGALYLIPGLLFVAWRIKRAQRNTPI